MAGKFIEEIGYKAHEEGFFKEWQEKSSEYIKKHPSADRLSLYEKAFRKLKKKQVNE